jgi:hypothetical protein
MHRPSCQHQGVQYDIDHEAFRGSREIFPLVANLSTLLLEEVFAEGLEGGIASGRCPINHRGRDVLHAICHMLGKLEASRPQGQGAGPGRGKEESQAEMI